MAEAADWGQLHPGLCPNHRAGSTLDCKEEKSKPVFMMHRHSPPDVRGLVNAGHYFSEQTLRAGSFVSGTRDCFRRATALIFSGVAVGDVL